jgi:hypothetical protein
MATSYVHDRPVRGLVTNLSSGGLSMSAIAMLAPPPGLVVGVELEVPGVAESIWASARVCYRSDDRGRSAKRGAAPRPPGPRESPWVDELASGLGMRFVAMARAHAQLIRELCIDLRRKSLGTLLARIRV